MEYLIRRSDGEWFDLNVDQYEAALKPITFPSEPGEGDGEWCILVEGIEIVFFYEDPGIHVIFEGVLSESAADQIVDEIRESIEAVTGQAGRVVPL